MRDSKMRGVRTARVGLGVALIAVGVLLAVRAVVPPRFEVPDSPDSLKARVEEAQRRHPEPFIMPQRLPPGLTGFAFQPVDERFYELMFVHYRDAERQEAVSVCVGHGPPETTCSQANADVLQDITVDGVRVLVAKPGTSVRAPDLRSYWTSVPLAPSRPDWLDLPALAHDDLPGAHPPRVHPEAPTPATSPRS